MMGLIRARPREEQSVSRFLHDIVRNKNQPSYSELMMLLVRDQGQVVQSIVSLTNPFRGQLIKCFTALFPNILIFFVGKMREALQKLHTFFQQKNIGIFEI